MLLHIKAVGEGDSVGISAVSTTAERFKKGEGQHRVFKKEACLAYGKHCSKCDKLNHFAA